MGAKTRAVIGGDRGHTPSVANNTERAQMEQQRGVQPVQSKLAIIVQQGRVLDFIDGKTQRNETPEEYVRQEIAKSLVREYRYQKTAIEVEFTIRVGSHKPRADLVIFPEGAPQRPA